MADCLSLRLQQNDSEGKSVCILVHQQKLRERKSINTVSNQVVRRRQCYCCGIFDTLNAFASDVSDI